MQIASRGFKQRVELHTFHKCTYLHFAKSVHLNTFNFQWRSRDSNLRGWFALNPESIALTTRLTLWTGCELFMLNLYILLPKVQYMHLWACIYPLCICLSLIMQSYIYTCVWTLLFQWTLELHFPQTLVYMHMHSSVHCNNTSHTWCISVLTFNHI